VDLLHEATALDALLAAAQRAAIGKRQQPEVARFLMDAERECLQLQRELRLPVDHPVAWRPSPVWQLSIRDPKPRMITVAPFRDRVVHQALCEVIGPTLERSAIHHSYACRRGKGQHRALRQAQRFARRRPWVYKGDIRAYFASVPHDLVMRSVRRRVGDADICDRIERALQVPVPDCLGGRGLPVGSLVSQHLANHYLGELDHWVTDGLGHGCYVRYMDDFLVFGERGELRELARHLPELLAERLGLALNDRRSRVMPVRDGVPFLGFRVFPRLIRPNSERWRRFRRRHEAIELALVEGRMDQAEAACSLASQFAHLAAFDTHRARRNQIARQAGDGGRGRWRLEPGDPGRLLEERPAQRARGEPQQERPGEPQRQRRLSSRELNTGAAADAVVLASGSDGRGSWTPPLRPGVDQTPVPCPAPSGGGTEAPPAGGGASGVAAGPLQRGTR
jgi:hypothetical protein